MKKKAKLKLTGDHSFEVWIPSMKRVFSCFYRVNKWALHVISFDAKTKEMTHYVDGKLKRGGG